uniref:RNA-directed DNA polymerase n=1 Tax=Strigamia maritima TaxID=126957 RepID=T1IWL5_STRMM
MLSFLELVVVGGYDSCIMIGVFPVKLVLILCVFTSCPFWTSFVSFLLMSGDLASWIYIPTKDNEKKKLNKPPNWMEKIGGYMLDSKESTNKDGLLVYFNPTFDKELNNSGNGFKAVVPRSLIRRVMFACHGHPLSGHAGISKTIHRTKQIYYWPKMSRHIRVYVRSCQHCQQYKPNQINCFVDASWATSPGDRKSVTGYIVCIGSNPVIWRTTKQNLVTMSAMEAELIALSELVKEIIWFRRLLSEVINCFVDASWATSPGDLVWRKTHILSDKDNNITKDLAIKRDGPWEITKIHGGGAYELTKIGNRKIEKSINTQDLLPYIPSYPIEEWEENQLVGTNTEHPNPN